MGSAHHSSTVGSNLFLASTNPPHGHGRGHTPPGRRRNGAAAAEAYWEEEEEEASRRFNPRLDARSSWRPMAGDGEDEAAAIERQLEQQLQEQQSSLAAVDEALAADPSNADLLEVRPDITASSRPHLSYHDLYLLSLLEPNRLLG